MPSLVSIEAEVSIQIYGVGIDKVRRTHEIWGDGDDLVVFRDLCNLRQGLLAQSPTSSSDATFRDTMYQHELCRRLDREEMASGSILPDYQEDQDITAEVLLLLSGI